MIRKAPSPVPFEGGLECRPEDRAAPALVIEPTDRRFAPPCPSPPRVDCCRDARARASGTRRSQDIVQRKKPAVLRRAGSQFAISVAQTLTSGPREAGPFEPPLGPLGFGLRGTLRLRVPGSFSGFGVTGPSTYSKPIFSWAASPATSSFTRTTRAWPPPFSLPNSPPHPAGFLRSP